MSELDVSPEPQARIARRSFIKRGILGGAALAVASGGYLALRPGKPGPAAPNELKAVDPANFPLLIAVIARVIPPDSNADLSAIALAIDETLSYTPPQVRKEMNLGMRLLENGLAGLFTRGSATPFTLLAPEEQDQALLRWRDAGNAMLNAAYHGLRKLTLGKYYQDLKQGRAIGYPGPVFEKPDPGPIEPRARISPPFVVGTHVSPKEPAHE